MAKAAFQEASGQESTKPGDSGTRSASDERNQLSALFQGDLAPLRPRAQTVANMTLAVGASLVQSFFGQLFRDSEPVDFVGGNSPAITAPAANPRYDILTLNVAGSLAWVTGTENASPVEPWADVPEDSIPICVVYCRTTMTKIVNYEDKDANPTHGYIAKDVRPFFMFRPPAQPSSSKGYMYGLEVANNATDLTNDLDIAVGVARDDTDTYDIILTSAITKRGDAAFAAGTGNGGGSVTGAAGKRYIYLIGKTTDATAADVFMSSSAPGSVSLPSTWDIKRLICVLYWNGSSWERVTVTGKGADKWVTFRTPITLVNEGTSSNPIDVDASTYVNPTYTHRLGLTFGGDAGKIAVGTNGASPSSPGELWTVADGGGGYYVTEIDSSAIFEYDLDSADTGVGRNVDINLRAYELNL